VAFSPDKTILYGVPRLTLQQWLTEGQIAYSQLASGQKVVSASYDGKSVTYAQSDRTALQEWLMMLQAQLGITRGRRALRPIFR
jgi:gpW